MGTVFGSCHMYADCAVPIQPTCPNNVSLSLPLRAGQLWAGRLLCSVTGGIFSLQDFLLPPTCVGSCTVFFSLAVNITGNYGRWLLTGTYTPSTGCLKADASYWLGDPIGLSVTSCLYSSNTAVHRAPS